MPMADRDRLMGSGRRAGLIHPLWLGFDLSQVGRALTSINTLDRVGWPILKRVTSGRVSGFSPAASGFHFPNRFTKEPVLLLNLWVLKLPAGDASRGLCGGMVFAVRDLFEAGLPPPGDTEAPRRGTALFRYLVRRLFSSFDLPSGPLRYLVWMALPSRSFLGIPGVRARTARAWTRIRIELDQGRPAALGLVRARSVNPLTLARNHQVLAYGYDLAEDSGTLRIPVYDPNHPDDDGPALQLRLDSGQVLGEIGYVPGERPVRGFFLTRYRPADPTSSREGT
jgi:hypothetical protein